ncbi:MAG: iron-containing redox enzyme family protein, partial [Pseudomonadales bacterium]|nr:iron-containing redox enzyme family protein [Pseudomonadales bacterium]
MATPKLLKVRSRNEFHAVLDAWSERHPLHTHPYLEALFADDVVGIEQIKRFSEVLYVFCETFHDCLIHVLAKTRDENIRRAIVQNLYEEYGAGTDEQGHLCLMRQLLRSMGYTEDSIA